MSYAVEKWLSATLIQQLGPALGPLRAWRLGRLIWLSGALDSRSVTKWGERPMIGGGIFPRRMLDEPDASEVLLRTWPELQEAWKARYGV